MLITCEVNLYHDIKTFLRNVQFGHEVTSRRFCAVYNLTLKLLQVGFHSVTKISMNV